MTSRRFRSVRFVSLTLVGLLAVAGLTGCRGGGAHAPTAEPLPSPVKAVWVVRTHYRTPDDVRTIIRNCAKMGCNTVLWQVRGNGTVMYPSRIEPWAEQLDYRSPGFDPLALAVEEAHAQGLRLEVWFNVMPGWKGRTPPSNPQQLYNAHPEWFMYDTAGHRQPLNDFYVIVNPCLPEVRRYLCSLIEEIAANYAVDGVHLDYIRYAWDETPGAREAYPGDPRSRELFARQTGKRPEQDARAWETWRANQLTQLVADIRTTLKAYRPNATLTAAVFSDPKRAYGDYLQNGGAWLAAGLLDAVMPMAYSEDVERVRSSVVAYRQASGGRRVVPGIGVYKLTRPDELANQLNYCASVGGDYALFSYESLHATAGERGRPVNAKVRDQRAALRTVLVGHTE